MTTIEQEAERLYVEACRSGKRERLGLPAEADYWIAEARRQRAEVRRSPYIVETAEVRIQSNVGGPSIARLFVKAAVRTPSGMVPLTLGCFLAFGETRKLHRIGVIDDQQRRFSYWAPHRKSPEAQQNRQALLKDMKRLAQWAIEAEPV